jgi:putative endonuclease
MKSPWVYLMANKPHRVLDCGVTSDLIQRVWQHKQGATPGFTAKYNIKLLAYFEQFESMTDAILREKQIKAGSRAKKIALIESANPEWKDLYASLL